MTRIDELRGMERAATRLAEAVRGEYPSAADAFAAANAYATGMDEARRAAFDALPALLAVAEAAKAYLLAKAGPSASMENDAANRLRQALARLESSR